MWLICPSVSINAGVLDELALNCESCLILGFSAFYWPLSHKCICVVLQFTTPQVYTENPKDQFKTSVEQVILLLQRLKNYLSDEKDLVLQNQPDV